MENGETHILNMMMKAGKRKEDLPDIYANSENGENNNWFEVNTDGSSYEELEEPYYTLDSAVNELLSRIKKAKS